MQSITAAQAICIMFMAIMACVGVAIVVHSIMAGIAECRKRKRRNELIKYSLSGVEDIKYLRGVTRRYSGPRANLQNIPRPVVVKGVSIEGDFVIGNNKINLTKGERLLLKMLRRRK